MPKKAAEMSGLVTPIAELPALKRRSHNPTYDLILDDVLARPKGNYKVETEKITSKPRTVYVSLKHSIKKRNIKSLTLSFRSGMLYIIKTE